MKQAKKMTRKMKEKLSKKHLDPMEYRLIKVDEREGVFVVEKKNEGKEQMTFFL